MGLYPVERGFNLNHLRGDTFRAGFHRSDIVLQRGQNGFQFAQDNACLGVIFGLTGVAVAASPTPQTRAGTADSGPRTLLTVAQVQEALNARGYPVGKPDGKTGPRTVDALKRFQRAVALPSTGELDEKTSDALRRK